MFKKSIKSILYKSVLYISSVFIVLLLISSTTMAASQVSLNRWALNVTLHDDGIVEDVIQAEINNNGNVPIDGLTLIVPASSVTVVYDFDHTYSFTGVTVSQKPEQGGIKLTVNFNDSVQPGKTWSGRIGFIARNWAVTEGRDYSLTIPIAAPEIIASGNTIKPDISSNIEVRSQIFLPKSYEVISVTPKPFRILFQYMHMVPTWGSENLHIDDTIKIKASYSEPLHKIILADEKLKSLRDRENKARSEGIDVSAADEHLTNANTYIEGQALGNYWENDYAKLDEDIKYAESELALAEDLLNTAPKSTEPKTGQPTQAPAKTTEKSPLGLEVLFAAIFLVYIVRRVKREK